MTALKNKSNDEIVPAWHKQFWPWFLIILPGIVVIASIGTVILAFMRADTLVENNYYKEGLAINKTVSDIQKAKQLNIEGVLVMNKGKLLLSLASKIPITDAKLLITFNHPFNQAQDVEITLDRKSANQYAGDIPALDNGKWYITLQSTDTASPWRITNTHFLPKNTLTLRPE